MKILKYSDKVPGVKRLRTSSYKFYVSLKWIVIQVVVAVFVLGAIMWSSVFLYGTFHYAFMPSVSSYEQPLHLSFRTDCETVEKMCSFPSTNISLISNTQKEILTRGQPYAVYIDLEMPESYVNQQLGMFMVDIEFYTVEGKVLFTASRSGILRFKSYLYRIVETLYSIPSLLYGSTDQKQIVRLEMSPHYVVDLHKPTVGAVISVRHKKIEIYSTMLRIYAQFFGLRYFLYYWPKLSAVVGISTNFFFLSVLVLFWWIKLFGSSNSESEESFNEDTDILKKSLTGDLPNDDATSLPEDISSNISWSKKLRQRTEKKYE